MPLYANIAAMSIRKIVGAMMNAFMVETSTLSSFGFPSGTPAKKELYVNRPFHQTTLAKIDMGP